MLKKLVKYGNSNALILDRAILELLNISEGAVVKLQTDGKSLIITPQEPVKTAEVFMNGTEMIQNAMVSTVEKQMEDIKADPVKNQQYEDWKPGTENSTKLMQAFKEIMDKYRDDFGLLQTESFLHDADMLAEKYQGDKSSPSYIKDFLALRITHAPRLADMDKEMTEAKKALGMPDYL